VKADLRTPCSVALFGLEAFNSGQVDEWPQRAERAPIRPITAHIVDKRKPLNVPAE